MSALKKRAKKTKGTGVQEAKTSLRQQAVELLDSLVSIPSVNPACLAHTGLQGMEGFAGESRIAAWLMDWGRRNGVAAREVEAFPGRPCVIFETPAEHAGAPEIACFAHADTVWTPGIKEPFKLKESEGRLYGLGAADDKASIVSGLMALLMLKDRPARKARFTFACTCDEESGFGGIKHLVPALLKPDAAIVCEGTDLDIVSAHKGVVRWDVEAIGHAVHASLIPQGRNAIYSAARLMLSMEVHLGRLLERDSHPLLGKPTLNVGVVKGGTQANSVPDKCSFTIERRLLPGESVESAEKSVRAELERCEEPFTLGQPYSFVPAFEMPQKHPWTSSVLDCVRKVNPACRLKGLQCATEAAHTALHGIPTLVFGPGSLSVAHSVDEHVNPEEIVKAAEALASLAGLDIPRLHASSK